MGTPARCLGGCGLPTRARHCSEQPRRRCNVLPASGCLGFHDRARAAAAARWQIPLPVPPRPTNLHAVRQDDSPSRLAHAARACGHDCNALECGVRGSRTGHWGKILYCSQTETPSTILTIHIPCYSSRSCYCVVCTQLYCVHAVPAERLAGEYPLAGATIARYSIDHIDHR